MDFHHEAALYAGEDEFLPATLPFLQNALAAGEPAMVAVSADKAARLKSSLGRSAARVRFVDMRAIGLNPGSIISEWREFVDESSAPGRRVWGIGEPAWPERSSEEFDECYRHECLLNVAFADARGFRLLCPYDTETLPREVIDRAFVSHPVMLRDGVERTSRKYRHPSHLADLLGEPLPAPPSAARHIEFDDSSLPSVRQFVLTAAQDAGVTADDARDFVLAVHELATNTTRYGGGTGKLTAWHGDGTLVCEVCDGGLISDALAGRLRPPRPDGGGFGLWMVNQICDLVQLRSSASGTVVRVHKRSGEGVRESGTARG